MWSSLCNLYSLSVLVVGLRPEPLSLVGVGTESMRNEPVLLSVNFF